MKRVHFRPAAAADIENAIAWYDDQRSGLGEEFLGAIEEAIGSIRRHPAACAVVHRGARRFLVRRFPYVIFYSLQNESIFVIACMHASRDPWHWQSRIE